VLSVLNGCEPLVNSPVQTDTPLGPTASREVSGQDWYQDLAFAWAPVLHQDVDTTGSHGLGGKADWISAINFDGDWVATNNWNNASKYTLSAHGYYSVVETTTHWYILYAFFHPRDWTDIPFFGIDEHENDLEGCLLIVYKDGSTYGTLEGMVTVFHTDFYSFVPDGSPLTANQETVDGKVSFVNHNGRLRPIIAQEAKGHGLKAYPYVKINGDGIIYWPSKDTAGVPISNYDGNCTYKLVDIFTPGGLFEQRTNRQLFAADGGSFLSSYGSGNANAPWRWDDKDDTPGAGALAIDPAYLSSVYFKGFRSFSREYLNNRYR
jgi:hypothetical protein